MERSRGKVRRGYRKGQIAMGQRGTEGTTGQRGRQKGTWSGREGWSAEGGRGPRKERMDGEGRTETEGAGQDKGSEE